MEGLETVLFSKGPAIAVILKFEMREFKSAALSFSEKFQCDLIGDVDRKLKNELLLFLEGYGKKEPIRVKLPLEGLSPFRQKVLARLQEVPFGEILTYGELASAVDHPRAARAVGTACHFNPFPLFIPCHRVIASGGRMGGFAYDIEMKKRLLDFESASNGQLGKGPRSFRG
jgi:O-6-methylguanine DNA methyltransferase